MRKKGLIAIILSAVLLAVGIGVTIAYLIASSNIVKNTFTVGSVDITLSETTGEEYKIIPGATIQKNPTVSVLADSEECWLFIKIEKEAAFDAFCDYAVADGWIALAGHNGIYYQTVGRSDRNTVFKVLKDNSIFIKDTVTESMLDSLGDNPILKFTAYAVQCEGVDSAHEAWQILAQ